MRKKVAFVFCCFLFTCSIIHAQSVATKFIGFNARAISYMGRVGSTDSCSEIYWTGTSIKMNVQSATFVKALLADETGNNYYYVIVDGDETKAIKIKIEKEKKWYTLVSNLDAKKHLVELFKVTNTDFVTTRFYGFETDAAAKILKAGKKPKRKIEFIGNSITCGHAAEDSSNDSGAPEYFNNYRAYGAITARHLNAQYHCTSKSGIGITVSWFPEVMPDIFNRLNPKDANSKWDFSRYVPDIVVVNLFQNDSWLVNMPDHAQFKARFGTEKPTEDFIINAYKNFIQTIRGNYPKATIICCLGNMDATREGSKWPGYVDAAVALLNDRKIVTHYFPYKNSQGHPNKKEQQAMADDLVAFIEKNKFWK
jgi:hypothetical protein